MLENTENQLQGVGSTSYSLFTSSITYLQSRMPLSYSLASWLQTCSVFTHFLLLPPVQMACVFVYAVFSFCDIFLSSLIEPDYVCSPASYSRCSPQPFRELVFSLSLCTKVLTTTQCLHPSLYREVTSLKR